MTNTSKICPVCGNAYAAADLFCPRDRSPLRSAGESDELIGNLVGDRYLISERIGVGGMGEVYLAHDVRLQRPAAVKVLRAGLAGDLESLTRFNREASNAARINDPHVVQVYDYGETDQRRPFLAMELVPGTSLRAILDREVRLEPGRAAELIGQIASGLEAAHRLDIVHRDLKPDNVLVSAHPAGGELAKVVDFGISKALHDDTQRVTRTGYVTGTCEFMSPEQVKGGLVDRRTDVYSLGLVAYLMLTGRLPFKGETAEHSMLLRLSQAPLRLRDAAPNATWPDALQSVFDRVLAPDPADRYASAPAFAADLAATLQPRAAEPEGRRYRPWLVGAAVAGATVMLVAAVLSMRPDSRADPGPPIVLRTEVDSGVDEIASAESTTTAMSEVTGEPKEPIEPEPDRARRSTTVKTEPRRPTREVRPTPEAARVALGDFAKILHAELPADSVGLVLDSLSRLLPHLATRRDSVDADILRAEAYGKLERWEEACAILADARKHANESQRRKIQIWVQAELCSFPGSVAS